MVNACEPVWHVRGLCTLRAGHGEAFYFILFSLFFNIRKRQQILLFSGPRSSHKLNVPKNMAMLIFILNHFDFILDSNCESNAP